MKPSRIQAVDHVNLEAASALAEDLRWFYGEVAGLEQVPGNVQAPAHLCFKSASLELRIWFVAKACTGPMAIRVTLAVPSLAEAAEGLEERSVPYARLNGIMFTDRRLVTHDPAGNAVVLKQEWPAFSF